MDSREDADAGVDSPGDSTIVPHRPYEDVQALLTGTLFVAMGVVFFRETGLFSGGTAGLAFMLHYATGMNFGLMFFVVNLPFYVLAWKRMGAKFTLKTFTAVGLLAAFSEAVPHWLDIASIDPWFSAVAGGLLIGAGMLMLFRHKASLGGFNVLVLWLQERYGWRAGKIQMAMDCAIVLVSVAFVDASRIGWSIVGAVVLNLILAINHRPGRYMAV